MSCLQPWILTFIPYGYPFFLQQEHHIVPLFLRGQMEEYPANMHSHGKIHFVRMFCFLFFDDDTVDQHLRYIIRNQTCPYFLFDILWLVRMVVATVDCRFQFTERGFDRPSPVAESLSLSGENSSLGRFVTIHSQESAPIGNLTIRKVSVYVLREPYSIKSKAEAWAMQRLQVPWGQRFSWNGSASE